MIVGNGLIARVFKGTKFDSLGITIFASGVSDSLSKNTNAFLREETLLKKYLALNQPLVYFSTLSIFDPTRNQSHYVRHKIEMEKLVTKSPSNLVIRLPEVVGQHGNANTLVFFLRAKIESGEIFDVWTNVWRNLVGISEVYSLIETRILDIKENRRTLNVLADSSFEVSEIVQTLEEILGKKGNYRSVERIGTRDIYEFPNNELENILFHPTSKDYLWDLLVKYQ